MFWKKLLLRNFEKFAGKHLCQSLIFKKVADLKPATLLKRALSHIRFPMNFTKFLRTPLQNIPGGCFCWSLGIHAIEYQNINEKNQIIFEKYILVEIFSSDNQLQKPPFEGNFCERSPENFINFQENIPSKCQVTCNFVLKSNSTGMFFLEIYEIFRTAILRNNLFVAILLSFFITYFANLIYSSPKLLD